MNTNELQENTNQDLILKQLKHIKDHLKCQDMKAKEGVYGSYGAFGAGIILVGISLLLGSDFNPSNDLFANSIFLIVMGFGVMFWSCSKQKKNYKKN
jgi:hypothetical protein